jgi:hypothetical protein
LKARSCTWLVWPILPALIVTELEHVPPQLVASIAAQSGGGNGTRQLTQSPAASTRFDKLPGFAF